MKNGLRTRDTLDGTRENVFKYESGKYATFYLRLLVEECVKKKKRKSSLLL